MIDTLPIQAAVSRLLVEKKLPGVTSYDVFKANNLHAPDDIIFVMEDMVDKGILGVNRLQDPPLYFLVHQD